MANCKTCGEKAGALKSECDSCKSNRAEQEYRAQLAAQEAENERQRQERERLQAALDARYQKYLEDCFNAFSTTLELGLTPYVYRFVVVNSESYLHGDNVGDNLELNEVQFYAQRGWEIATMHPITSGHGLQNTSTGSVSGTTWGGGIGGLVVGAYVVMRLPLNEKVMTQRRNEVIDALDNYFPG